MAYPTFPDVVRVQVRMQGSSNLPEDVFVNTWYFEETFPIDSWEDPQPQQDVWNFLDGFYGTAHGAAAFPIVNFLSPLISSVEYVMSPLYVDPPRYPIATQPASWLPSGGTPLPTELAAVMSFHGNEGPTQTVAARPRRRGRIYLGPLTVSAVNPSSSAQTIALDLNSSITEAAAWALTQQDTNGVRWVVVSPTQGQQVSPLSGIRFVNGGFVDNAFDVQRRRGIAPSLRTNWGTAIA